MVTQAQLLAAIPSRLKTAVWGVTLKRGDAMQVHFKKGTGIFDAILRNTTLSPSGETHRHFYVLGVRVIITDAATDSDSINVTLAPQSGIGAAALLYEMVKTTLKLPAIDAAVLAVSGSTLHTAVSPVASAPDAPAPSPQPGPATQAGPIKGSGAQVDGLVEDFQSISGTLLLTVGGLVALYFVARYV